MAGRKPDYRVCTAEEGQNGDKFFTDVGSAWSFSSDKAAGISVKLRPNLAVMGELVLFESRD